MQVKSLSATSRLIISVCTRMQSPEASGGQIRKAYYSMMKECHPDLTGEHPDSTAFCKFINEVYEVWKILQIAPTMSPSCILTSFKDVGRGSGSESVSISASNDDWYCCNVQERQWKVTGKGSGSCQSGHGPALVRSTPVPYSEQSIISLPSSGCFPTTSVS